MATLSWWRASRALLLKSNRPLPPQLGQRPTPILANTPAVVNVKASSFVRAIIQDYSSWGMSDHGRKRT
jgi:hypothetical protein